MPPARRKTNDTNRAPNRNPKNTKIKMKVWSNPGVGYTPHAYASTTKNSSARTVCAAAVVSGSVQLPGTGTIGKNRTQKRNAARRSNAKLQRISVLRQFSTVDTKRFPTPSPQQLEAKSHFYAHESFLLGGDDQPFTDADECVAFSANNMLLDEGHSGSIFRDEAGEIVYIKCPRGLALRSQGERNAWLDAMSLDYLVNRPSNVKRGQAKKMKPTQEWGHHALRGSPGVGFSKLLRDHPWHAGRAKKLCMRLEKVVATLVPFTDLMRISCVRDTVAPFDTLVDTIDKKKDSGGDNAKEVGKSSGIFATQTATVDYISAAHKDCDFFYSVLTCRVVNNLSSVRKYRFDPDGSFKYRDRRRAACVGAGKAAIAESREDAAVVNAMNEQWFSPIAHYFVFPSHGVAVGIRPGDMVIFNPMHHHCCSLKKVAYKDNPVFLSAFYLNTAVVGGNDNGVELTELQQKTLATRKQQRSCDKKIGG